MVGLDGLGLNDQLIETQMFSWQLLSKVGYLVKWTDVGSK